MFFGWLHLHGRVVKRKQILDNQVDELAFGLLGLVSEAIDLLVICRLVVFTETVVDDAVDQLGFAHEWLAYETDAVPFVNATVDLFLALTKFISSFIHLIKLF